MLHVAHFPFSILANKYSPFTVLSSLNSPIPQSLVALTKNMVYWKENWNQNFCQSVLKTFYEVRNIKIHSRYLKSIINKILKAIKIFMWHKLVFPVCTMSDGIGYSRGNEHVLQEVAEGVGRGRKAGKRGRFQRRAHTTRTEWNDG